MISPGHVLYLLIVGSFVLRVGAPVSPRQAERLTRDQLLQFDRDVSRYFVETYEQLDEDNTTSTTYDEQLFKSIKAIRHTNVVHHLDFRYTSNETRWRSAGARVDARLCKRQLEVLAQLAQGTQDIALEASGPLSVLDFFEASGKTGSGILNGNFVWLGSYATCERAKIPARVWSRLLNHEGDANDESQQDIRGRYCVAHLRARSWPKWDLHFEDRITVRRGVCLPESCHSATLDDTDDVQLKRLVDQLARHGLLPPFGGERYETQSVFCLPDEDSPHRQLDLGARLLLAFGALWALITLYANVKYHWRAQAVRALRDTVDITMIINCEESTGGGDSLARQDSRSSPTLATHLEANLQSSDASSAHSSACATPLPSDLEDADSDPEHLVEPFKLRRRKPRGGKRTTNVNYKYQPEGEEPPGRSNPGESVAFDFVRDFAIGPNLSWLLAPRASSGGSSSETLQDSSSGAPHHQKSRRGSNVVLQQQQQQAPSGNSGARRASSSNEALVRELQERNGREQAASAAGNNNGDEQREAPTQRPPAKSGPKRAGRVNVDVLDGLKVIATTWIVLGHTFMFFFIFLKDIRFGAERMFDLSMTMLINTLQVVGLFYVITGCLLTYISFSRASRRQLLNPLFWLLVLVGRYIRLVPVYALVFWFARHLAPHTGQGRDWLDYRTDGEHPRGFCAQESWWVMLSMSAADVKIPMDCVPQAWYLSDDFRTLLVLPAYVFLLAKNARLGYAAIATTIVYSTWRLAAILNAANIDYKLLLLWQPHVYALMVDRLHHVYTDFFVRMSTYLLGVVVGHLLHLYEIRAIREWPRWLRMRVPLAMAASLLFGVQILSSPLVRPLLPAHEQLHSAHVVWLIPLFKGAMELSLASLILLLVTGGGLAWVRNLLASRLLKILSSVSYAVFLVHVEVMYKMPITRVESNYWQLLLYASFVITFSHAVAFLVHLLYEIPLNNLSRRLLRRGAKLV